MARARRKSSSSAQQSARDNFRQPVKTLLAQRVGWLCSNPKCQQPTMGPRMGKPGSMNLGVAAHIKAASPGFARYDSQQSEEERHSFDNGIWLCQNHAHQIDHDEKLFTVELLHTWKGAAEQRAFDQLTGGKGPARVEGPTLDLIEELRDILATLSLPVERLPAVRALVTAASIRHVEAFERHSNWPVHAVSLALATQGTEDGAPTYGAPQLAHALQAVQKLAVIAPPGTGKSTTLLQMARSLMAGGPVPIFIPLREWAETHGDMFAWAVNRHAFAGVRADHLKFLAFHGRLALKLLTAKTNITPTARRKLILELEGLGAGLPASLHCYEHAPPSIGCAVAWAADRSTCVGDTTDRDCTKRRRSSRPPCSRSRVAYPGLRDLASIPLYLSVLLRISPAGHAPETKEEVLRLFVEEHEKDPARADVFDRELLGNQKYYLRALAVEAHLEGNTSISSTGAAVTLGKVNANLLSTYVVQHAQSRTRS